MKKTFQNLCFISIILILFSGCSKEDSDIFISSGSISAKINGATWNAASQLTRVTSNQIIITATALNGDVVNITVFGTQPGIYRLGLDAQEIRFSGAYKTNIISGNSKNYLFTQGVVEIKSIDAVNKKINGTFEMVATAQDLSVANITNGQFVNISYSSSN